MSLSEPVDEVLKAWRTGDCAGVATKAAEALKENEWKDDFWVLQIRALMAEWKFEDALKTTNAVFEKVSLGVRVRLLAEEVFRFNGDSERVDAALMEINWLAGCECGPVGTLPTWWPWGEPPLSWARAKFGAGQSLLGSSGKGRRLYRGSSYFANWPCRKVILPWRGEPFDWLLRKIPRIPNCMAMAMAPNRTGFTVYL
jgi:hypothetical protein